MSEQASVETVLRERLESFPPDRYPMQHATTAYHLGTVLAADPERLAEAEEALVTSASLFEPRVGPEAAKAVVALGAVLRARGRVDEAAEAFEQAAAEFAEHEQQDERGAALFNLGLARRDLQDLDGSAEAFEAARRLLSPRSAPRQAAAAAREHGTTLFLAERGDEAAEVLEEACDLARKAGDQEGLGAATNVLGLVRLAEGDHDRSAEALETAVRCHPRRIRPGAYAMAKANLALAEDARGAAGRARLLARQARDNPEAEDPVREQADELLGQLGDAGEGGLIEVLEGEPPDGRQAVVRDEIGRWIDLPPERRRSAAAAFVGGVIERGAPSADLLEALLRGMLEVPGDAMQQLATALIEATAAREGDDAGEFRARAARAMARFHAPQFLRLKDTFTRLAEEAGEPAGWG